MATKVAIKTEPKEVAIKQEAMEVPIEIDRVQKYFDDLEAQKRILSSCTQLFTTLSKHFTSLQDSLSQKSQSLDSKLQSLHHSSKETFESLHIRGNSIPALESDAAARIEEQKDSALAEFLTNEKPGDVSELLKSVSRRMDSSELVKFIVAKRKESLYLRAEISAALKEAVDPPRLVLDAIDDFISAKSGKGGVTDKRWACGLLLQGLFPEVDSERKKGPQFARSVIERAGVVAETWKAQLTSELANDILGPAEAVMFLQFVVGFSLKSRVDDEEFLIKLVVSFASRRDMVKLTAGLAFNDIMGDIIDELIKSGKEVEAVYFTCEFGLTERHPPVSLLKSYLRNAKKNATTILKKGNYSVRATEESSTVELNSAKAIIKCVEDHKLESEFPLDPLRKRITQLEASKAEKKKNSAANTKSQSKRSHGSSSGRSGAPPFRPAKAAKYSSAYSSFGRRSTVPVVQHSPASRYSGPYNFPVQTVYDIPPTTTPTTYPSYGMVQSPGPAAISHQHYTLPVENMNAAAAAYRTTASYPAQTSYATYDYGSVAPPAYQP